MTYLVEVDSHSKWAEVILLKSATSCTAVAGLYKIFLTHGILEALVLQNGT